MWSVDTDLVSNNLIALPERGGRALSRLSLVPDNKVNIDGGIDLEGSDILDD